MAQLCPSNHLIYASLLFLSLTSHCHLATSSNFNNETDRSGLLSFKYMISKNPSTASPLISWDSSTHFCEWPGVTCGHRHPQRVIFLELASLNLDGSIAASISNLTFLRKIDLSNNHIHGPIPQEIGRLYRLRNLDLSLNNLEQGIPDSLSSCSKLQVISLNNNKLQGEIPLSSGHFLPMLERIYLYDNRFHGPIPMALFNASRLEIIDLSSNGFSGTIPRNLGSLQNLKWLNLANNQLEARDPDGWSFFTDLTNCTNLIKLQLDFNKLGGILPNSIANFSIKLEKLTMSGNGISGNISPEVGKLVGLTTFDMGLNLLIGSIPASIGMLRNLHVLRLGNNKLSGKIPSTIGNLTQLNSLQLNSNELSGFIPSNLGNCQNLILLDLSFNRLTGGIPKEILSISTLSIYLNLTYNSLTGLIPSQVGRLINLGEINFSMNNLSGKLPSNLGNCQVLEKLYLAGNFFHGNISSSLSALRGMQELDLSRNNLTGKIPNFLQGFHFLNYVNLSFNNLEGEVPIHGVFANLSAASILGNNKLCGGEPSLHLPSCAIQENGNKHRFAIIMVIIVSVIGTFLFLLVFFYFTKKSRIESTDLVPRYEHGRISYAELERATNGFSTDNLIGVGSFGAVYKGTIEGFSEFGNPFLEYSNAFTIFSRTVAVKVLNLQQRGASNSFKTECNILKNTMHRNIVRIYTACSGTDSMGSDFKALVFEYVPNGSLDGWLHPTGNEQHEHCRLTFTALVKIAIDVASALDYLHNNSWRPIIHCDIKPGNILLDGDMTAHVGDFGLAKFPTETLIRSSTRTATSVCFRGTIGYIAPEYGTANSATTKGDVYSYGILLLEMFTGKRPTDDTFRRDMSLRRYVEMSIPERVFDIFDSRLLLSESIYQDVLDLRILSSQSIYRSMVGAALECASSLLRIGVVCSSELPAHRPEIRDVVKRLQVITNVFWSTVGSLLSDEGSSQAHQPPESNSFGSDSYDSNSFDPS